MRHGLAYGNLCQHAACRGLGPLVEAPLLHASSVARAVSDRASGPMPRARGWTQSTEICRRCNTLGRNWLRAMILLTQGTHGQCGHPLRQLPGSCCRLPVVAACLPADAHVDGAPRPGQRFDGKFVRPSVALRGGETARRIGSGIPKTASPPSRGPAGPVSPRAGVRAALAPPPSRRRP